MFLTEETNLATETKLCSTSKRYNYEQLCTN